MAGAIVVNGQIGLTSGRQSLALSGKYFTVTNPTPGTGVVWATLPTVSATANGFFVIANGAAGGGPTIVLDRLEIKETATAPTATLSLNFEFWNETGAVTGTGNVATLTPVQSNTAQPQSTVGTVQMFSAGAITIPAAVGTRRRVGTASIATGLCIAKDTYVLDFGQDGATPSIPGLTATRSTVTAKIAGNAPPVLVAPGTTTWANMWWDATATNIPSWEYCLSYFEVQT